ncbi:putative benzoate 4-monooxygenase cytochrome P450 protein [Rosellinia necatrix]|uniref:Putative benzoate 4-monooxygenase cytochrome P450 protein n=1 Tax=Rosellinia necatrix TaxID=77044 RepID=A0A1S7UKX9_ROSNE|nr:putative benzoate 4-monooxygenase cytochrome P450 protein [Rosellinia necatrix]
MPSVSIPSALAFGVTLYVLLLFSYRLLLHPLRGFPGPFAAKLSHIYGGACALAQNTHLKVHQNHLRYGPVVRIAPDRLVFNTATALRDIYQNDRLVKSGAYRAAQHRAGVLNVFTAVDRAQHRARRRAVGAALSEQSMRAFEPAMAREVDTFIKQLFLAATTTSTTSSGVGVVDMTPACRHLSYDTAALLGFGRSLDLQTGVAGDGEGEGEGNRFVPRAISLGDLRINVAMNFPPLAAGHLHQRIAGCVPNSLRDRFYAVLGALTSARLGEPAHARHDLCSFMARSMAGKGKGEDQKPDRLDFVTEALFFFPAGGETSAVVLCALMFYLSRGDASARRCYERLAAEVRAAFRSGAEIRGGPRLAGCRYLRACIDEALRVSPPVTGMLWRELAAAVSKKEGGGGGGGGGGEGEEPLVIDGHVVPRGTQVAVNLYSLHHNAEYFPDPFGFRPERWLDGAADGAGRRAVVSDAFAPFLVGPRSCAGKSMAYLEVSLTVAKTLWYFDFEAAPGDAGKLGGGDPTRAGGRDRADEFQLYDRFSAHHYGPNLVFHPRETLYNELDVAA